MSKVSIRKRVAAFLLVAIISVTSFSGCVGQKDESLSVFIPLQKDSFQDFFSLFSENNPDVTFDISSYRGGSPSAYILRRFQMNDLTDIVITSYPPEDEIQESTLLDLSGYDFVHNYKASVLANLDVNGKIYLLDCPSSVRGIVYNETMFTENGWKIPENHEEFVALIKQINEEKSDVIPLGLQGKYPGTYFTLMSELSHCDYLQTPTGAAWKQSFASGEASSSEGFGTGIALIQDWLDAGAFNSKQVSLGDTAVYQMLVDRECAMAYVMGSQNKLVELTQASADEFSVLPIYGQGEDSEFVATTHGLKLGINKELGEPGNEEKLEKALRVMEFLSTKEGQMVFHTGLGDVLPIVGSDDSLPEMFKQVSAVIDRGHTAPFLYTGYEDILASAGEYIKNVCYNGGELEGVFEMMDSIHRDSLNNKELYIATVSETLDERQTAQFVANALNAQGYGDFAMVSMGRYSEYFDVSGGANGKLYQGGISTVEVNLPLTNLAVKNIFTLSLTGAQVRELLNSGRVLTDDEGHTDTYTYFTSGIEVERNSDGSVKSISLNGADLEDTQTYTVAFSPQDYSDEIALLGNAQDTGASWETHYRAYITQLGTITPEHAK